MALAVGKRRNTGSFPRWGYQAPAILEETQDALELSLPTVILFVSPPTVPQLSLSPELLT